MTKFHELQLDEALQRALAEVDYAEMTPVQAASRSLLTHLAPADRMTQFFGLFAFSGKVTSFMAPFLIAVVTRISGSQRIGMAIIAAFLIAGFLLLLPVRVKRPA